MIIYIIIPAFNEAPVVGQVLEALVPLGYHIIFVDDGSTDETARIAASFPVLLIRHRLNLGQGAALETGMEAARRLSADLVVHFDADGQHEAGDIEALLKPLRAERADIVFGSRFLAGSRTGLPLAKRFILRAARWINFGLSGILLSDAHNGMRAMNSRALSLIHLKQSGMAHATEILGCVKKYSLKQVEVPVHIRYTRYSRKKGQRLLNAVNILFHLLFKKS